MVKRKPALWFQLSLIVQVPRHSECGGIVGIGTRWSRCVRGCRAEIPVLQGWTRRLGLLGYLDQCLWCGWKIRAARDGFDELHKINFESNSGRTPTFCEIYSALQAGRLHMCFDSLRLCDSLSPGPQTSRCPSSAEESRRRPAWSWFPGQAVVEQSHWPMKSGQQSSVVRHHQRTASSQLPHPRTGSLPAPASKPRSEPSMGRARRALSCVVRCVFVRSCLTSGQWYA
jgi:hypothetical protein